jgi:uncharacterized protein YfiM (DUF2279 family)
MNKVLILIILLISVKNIYCFENNDKELSIDNFHNQFKFKITLSDPWLSKDKADHLLVSSFLVAGGYFVAKNDQQFNEQKALQFSVSSAFALGIVKEIRDGFRKHNAASIKDLIADVLGIGLGVVMFKGLDN